MRQFISIIRALVIILIPLILILASIRLLLTPALPQVEYNNPDFPADQYGLTLQERLQWSNVSIQYLLDSSDTAFLQRQRLADGTPLYNDRELKHMKDVKSLVQTMLIVLPTLAAFLVMFGILAWQGHWLREYWQALSRGGWLTLGLVLAILFGVFLSFNALFTGFHQIFFQGDTWLFLYSDNLIRLFPMRFWQDAFILMGALTIIGSIIVGFIGSRLAARVPIASATRKNKRPGKKNV